MGQKKNIYINRELSWLRFNERVLEEAEDVSIPLLERMKFVSIFGTNLDEFFMVRFGSLYDQNRAKPKLTDNKSSMTAAEQMDAICAALPPLIKRKDRCFKSILKALEQEGIRKVDFSKIDSADEVLLQKYFRKEVLPLLSPQVVHNKHTFPFLKNHAVYVAVQLKTKSEDIKLGIVPVADMERVHFVHMKSGSYFALTEELIYHFAGLIFSGYSFVDRYMIRITRNADLDVAEASFDEDLDWREIMSELLKRRKRQAPVRLQTNKPLSSAMKQYFIKNLNLKKNRIFIEKSPFDVTFAFRFENIFRKKYPQLLNVPLQPLYPKDIDHNIPVHVQAKSRDLLLCYPFQSIRPFVRLLEEAATDPETESIKITLYRVATNSQILAALLKAAENGKEVTAVLELRARFDEQNNIDWSRQLEAAGCNIRYGLDDYKVHSKILLITRKTKDGYAYTTQIGTGNYNEKTSEQYTDISMITSDKNIALEVKSVFDHIAMGEVMEQTDKLLVAPKCMLPQLLEKIDEQIYNVLMGKRGEVVIKCNSITDKALIDKLLEASRVGVKIKLFVRGICCFKAGVPEKSDNIVVKSIVGRFLEHSRIFVFGADADREIYISSADFMTRNTQNRVEVAAPVTDSQCKDTILKILEILDMDNVKTRIMQPDGTYVRYDNGLPPMDAQLYFFEMFGGQPASVLTVKNEAENIVDLNLLEVEPPKPAVLMTEVVEEVAVPEAEKEEKKEKKNKKKKDKNKTKETKTEEPEQEIQEKKRRPMIEEAERQMLLADMAELRRAETMYITAPDEPKQFPLWAKLLIGFGIGGTVCAAVLYYVIVHLGWNLWLI